MWVAVRRRSGAANGVAAVIIRPPPSQRTGTLQRRNTLADACASACWKTISPHSPLHKNPSADLTHYDTNANPRICAHASQCNGIRDRSKSVELWSGVAQYCLLVGNYNSATAILESLESPAIARLQTTVSYPRTHDYWASTPPHTLYQIGPFVGESFGAGGCLHYSLSRIPCKRVCMLICIHIVFLGVYACT